MSTDGLKIRFSGDVDGLKTEDARVAQPVEQSAENRRVGGSTPSPGTHLPRHTSNVKLTWARVHEIRALRVRGVPVIRLARRFGVDRMTIWRVVSGRIWKDGTEAASKAYRDPRNRWKLTWDIVHRIRQERAAGAKADDLADRYDLNRRTVHRIVAGRSWADGTEQSCRSVNHRVRLTWERVFEIRKLREQGLSFSAIAAKQGISVSTVGRVVHGHIWKGEGIHDPLPQGYWTKLNPEKIRRIRELWVTSTPLAHIAKELGVTVGAISLVVNEKNWRKEWLGDDA